MVGIALLQSSWAHWGPSVPSLSVPVNLNVTFAMRKSERRTRSKKQLCDVPTLKKSKNGTSAGYITYQMFEGTLGPASVCTCVSAGVCDSVHVYICTR
jgi:hypothetical protein